MERGVKHDLVGLLQKVEAHRERERLVYHLYAPGEQAVDTLILLLRQIVEEIVALHQADEQPHQEVVR